MPATAGRVRMPANNRVHSSAALQTHGIWQSAIGYDPYAPANDGSKPGKNPKPDNETENAYASFQGLLTLARITGTTSNETRGACKKCGRVGHLTYQCRNFLTLKDAADTNAGGGGAIQAPGDVIGFVKKEKEKAKGESEDESDEDEDEESSSSDSDVDPEIERIIAERLGKGMSKKIKKVSSDEESGDDRRRKKKYEHKKRRRSRHHHHHHSHRRRSRIESDSDSSSESSDDGYRKRSDRHRRKRRHKERRSVLSSGSESTASSSDEDERRRRRERRERRERKPSRARKSEEKD